MKKKEFLYSIFFVILTNLISQNSLAQGISEFYIKNRFPANLELLSYEGDLASAPPNRILPGEKINIKVITYFTQPTKAMTTYKYSFTVDGNQLSGVCQIGIKFSAVVNAWSDLSSECTGIATLQIPKMYLTGYEIKM